MPEKVTIKINGNEVSVDKGTRVLDAVKNSGAFVPHYCYHPKLSVSGNCRLCMVEIKGATDPAPRLQISCTVPVANGMEIFTQTEQVQKARKGVMEFLLINHPLDCPICDRVGECLLQDYSFAYGISESRYIEEKREFAYQDLGPHVQRDMNRCIHCTRCTRFMVEIANYEEYGVFFRGEETEIGVYPGHTLQSNFAGNMIDVCPVGALTDKVFRFKSRVYELTPKPSICTQCSVGCNITLGTKGRQVLRVKPRENLAVNDEWICDTGRFELGWYGAGERVDTPLIRRGNELVPVTWEEAATEMAKRVRKIKENFGTQTIGGIASPSETNEWLYLFQKFFRAIIGSNSIALSSYFGKTPAPHDLLYQAYGRAAGTGSIQGISFSPLIVLVGDRLRTDTPILELNIIQAVRKQRANLVTIDFPDERLRYLSKMSISCKADSSAMLLETLLGGILSTPKADHAECWDPEAWEGFAQLKSRYQNYDLTEMTKETGIPKNTFRDLVKLLASSPTTMFLYAGGRQAEKEGDHALLRALVNLSIMTCNPHDPWGGLMVLYPEANLQGAYDMGVHPALLPGYRKLEAAESFGKIWGADLPREPGFKGQKELYPALKTLRGLYLCADTIEKTKEFEGILRELDLLIVQTMRMNDTTAFAHIVLPFASPAEMDGTVTNIERRVQRILPAYGPPLDVYPAWEAFSILSRALGANWNYTDSEAIFSEISQIVPLYSHLSYAQIGNQGLPWPNRPTETLLPHYVIP